MTYTTKIKNPVFGTDEIKYWATSKQSFNKYFEKSLEAYNALMDPIFDITISKIDHIEIVRSKIKLFFKSIVSKKCFNISYNNLYFTFIDNKVYVI